MHSQQDQSPSVRGTTLQRITGLALAGIALGPVMGNVTRAYAQHPVAAAPLVFDGVTVIDVERGIRIPMQRVVIVGNHIRALGGAGTVRIPRGARVVDARGKYLIPGLWDMHVHAWVQTTFAYPLFLATGVTGIRDAGSPVPLDTLIRWRREIVAGTRVGPPRQILSGQSIYGPQPGCDRSKLLKNSETCIADSADARHYVDSLKAAGADMIKPRAVSRAMYFVIAAEARRVGIPFGGHAQAETPTEASDSGASIVDHMQHSMRARGISQLCWGASATVEHCQPVAERFRHNGTWLAPTLLVYNGGEAYGGGTYAKQVLEHAGVGTSTFWTGSLPHGNWLRDSASSNTLGASPPNALGAMHIMQQVGLPILAGTDISSNLMGALPGFTLHVELAMYVAEGLTPLAALQAATLNPAKVLHATDSLGTVAVGKLADLVLLDADPLTDITNTTTIRAIVANGRYFDRVALDQVLTNVQTETKARNKSRSWP